MERRDDSLEAEDLDEAESVDILLSLFFLSAAWCTATKEERADGASGDMTRLGLGLARAVPTDCLLLFMGLMGNSSSESPKSNDDALGATVILRDLVLVLAGV